MYQTPLLVNTNLNSVEDYVSSLAKTGKKNYNATMKKNRNIEYAQIEYNPDLIAHFMAVWEQQDIRGKKRQWGFGRDYINQLHLAGVLKSFAAYEILNGDVQSILSVHFVERYDDYIECHPPMYNKEETSDQYMAKFMWFELIKFAINSDINWVDLGGGNRGTWRDLLIHRHEHPKIKYKWLYVPKSVKDNPMEQPSYVRVFKHNKKTMEVR